MKRVLFSTPNAAVDTLILALIELVKTMAAEDENLLFVQKRLEELQAMLNFSIKRDKVYSGLEEADSVRDAILKRIDATLSGLAAIPVPEIADAAEKLLAEWKKYSLSIVNESYEKESSYIESFLADSQNYSAEIKALPGFQTLLDDLRAKEDAFKSKTDAFVKAQASGAKSATAIKKELVAFVNSCLLPYTEAMCIIKPEKFQPFASEIEVRISRASYAAK